MVDSAINNDLEVRDNYDLYKSSAERSFGITTAGGRTMNNELIHSYFWVVYLGLVALKHFCQDYFVLVVPVAA